MFKPISRNKKLLVVFSAFAFVLISLTALISFSIYTQNQNKKSFSNDWISLKYPKEWIMKEEITAQDTPRIYFYKSLGNADNYYKRMETFSGIFLDIRYYPMRYDSNGTITNTSYLSKYGNNLHEVIISGHPALRERIKNPDVKIEYEDVLIEIPEKRKVIVIYYIQYSYNIPFDEEVKQNFDPFLKTISIPR